MGIDVSAKLVIAKSRIEVAQYAMEPTNDPKWTKGIKEAELLTERPIGLGTQVRRMATFLGKEIHYVLKVVEYKSEQLMVMQSIKGPFPMKVTYQFDDENDATLAQIRVEGTSEGFYSFTDIFMSPQVKRSIQGDLKRLKTIMES
ncbi:hypothetical protein GC102_25860 [Paenibacillus sp. LMG 31460]|uniref:Polyketide cyclase / dehydrase and lipid transport n=1 Tax=Paenibacillus germinis TaxID=2654979 RepID=A0ABX1Z7A8_9BACL|nr:SRPBCC family protein [Paenibacillus germinis]NOU89148.1 hypothetical protein [Paenibacillus germinis]